MREFSLTTGGKLLVKASSHGLYIDEVRSDGYPGGSGGVAVLGEGASFGWYPDGNRHVGAPAARGMIPRARCETAMDVALIALEALVLAYCDDEHLPGSLLAAIVEAMEACGAPISENLREMVGDAYDYRTERRTVLRFACDCIRSQCGAHGHGREWDRDTGQQRFALIALSGFGC